MKKGYVLFLSILVFSLLAACTKQEPIPQDELPGTWVTYDVSTITDKIEITTDSKFYWDSYLKKHDEYDFKYDVNKNQISLFKAGCKKASYQATVQKEHKGRMNLNMVTSTIAADGSLDTQVTTYYKKD